MASRAVPRPWSHRLSQGASWELPESLLRASWELPESLLRASWEFPERFLSWESPESLLRASWESPESFLKAFWEIGYPIFIDWFDSLILGCLYYRYSQPNLDKRIAWGSYFWIKLSTSRFLFHISATWLIRIEPLLSPDLNLSRRWRFEGWGESDPQRYCTENYNW